jgi:hypothetical protein
MKKTKVTLFAICMIAFSTAFSQNTIIMGEGYAYDVYYSMTDGITGVADRTEWDLGFYTSPWSAGIITNGGSGIELRLYPLGDTAAWNSIDTNGMSGWPILYNGEDSWEDGAFNRHSTNHPDYGWGVYNAQSHDVIGDSIYIIKLLDGTYKKLWIVRKISIENKYIFRYGDLDNSHEKEKVLENNNFSDMLFSYFDFASESFFDREPIKEDWDILFTKYQAMQVQGVPYPVIGVLNNVTTVANRYYPVTMDYTNWYEQPMDSAKAVIGWDWKYFEFSTFTWTIEDSLLYFVSPPGGDIYKMHFTFYGGTATGEIQFEDQIVSLLDINDNSLEAVELLLAPNPASSYVNLQWDTQLAGDISIRVFDLTGKEVLYEKISANGQYKLDVSDLREGMYMISLASGNQVINKKLMID